LSAPVLKRLFSAQGEAEAAPRPSAPRPRKVRQPRSR
jgi:hypothetical protein